MIKEVILRDKNKRKFVYPDEVSGIWSLKRYTVIDKDSELERELQIVGFYGNSYGLLDPDTNKLTFVYEDILLERYLERLLNFDFKIYVETDDE